MRIDRRGVIRGGVGIAAAIAFNGTMPRVAAVQRGRLPANVENPPTLAACLPLLNWDPAERGPLLIVAPERAKTTLVQPIGFSEQRRASPPLDFGGTHVTTERKALRLSVISPRYRRKLVTVGSLSAAVPETMGVLRYKNLPKPDLFAAVRPETRPQLLLASLTKAQWRRLSSVDGLGIGDLERDQQAMFAGLLSETATLFRTNPPAPGQNQTKTEIVPLNGVRMADARLRLYKELSWTYLQKNTKGGGTLSMGNQRQGDDIKEPILRLQFNDSSADHAFNGGRDDSEVVENISVFGVNLLEALPNRAKPSDIDYDDPFWNISVSLSDARTVGELVARVRAATGVEIYSDKRYAELLVHTRAVANTGVRSGDLLKTLALSVTGTFRRVASGSETAFVMTDDRVGSGTRYALLNDWIQNATKELRVASEKIGGAAQEADVSGNAPWSLREDMIPSPALLKRMAGDGKGTVIPSEKLHEHLTPISELPPEVQERVRSQLDYLREQSATQDEGNCHYLHEEGVMIGTKPTLSLVLPGIGTIPLPHDDIPLTDRPANPFYPAGMDWYSRGMMPPDMTAKLPVRIDSGRITKRLLAVQVGNVEDARRAALFAHSHRFNAVLFRVGGQSAEEIAAWTAAARAAVPGIAVWLRTPLLRGNMAPAPGSAQAEESPTPPLDLTVREETYTKLLQRTAASPATTLARSPFPRRRTAQRAITSRSAMRTRCKPPVPARLHWRARRTASCSPTRRPRATTRSTADSIPHRTANWGTLLIPGSLSCAKPVPIRLTCRRSASSERSTGYPVPG